LAGKREAPALRIGLGIGAAALILCAAGALAEEQTNPPVTNNRDVMVCKRMPSATGTRLGATRECHTQREWEERQRDDRQMTERAQNSDRRGCSNPPC
jgi:hypothetical protein